MTPFWTGAIWASLFWILVYMIAVFIWAFVDARNRGAEMMNTEAANDRQKEYVHYRLPGESAVRFAPKWIWDGMSPDIRANAEVVAHSFD